MPMEVLINSPFWVWALAALQQKVKNNKAISKDDNLFTVVNLRAQNLVLIFLIYLQKIEIKSYYIKKHPTREGFSGDVF